MAIGFGVVLLVLALALSIGAVWLAYPLRRRVDQLAGDVNSLQAALDQLRAEQAELRAELAEVRAAAEVVPVPPPLPKSRPAGLDDLRQRLRAAHTEAEDTSEE
jgi:outer membrane murein-binding lipoprotein Lpp